MFLIFLSFISISGFELKTSYNYDFKDYLIKNLNKTNNTIESFIYKFDSGEIYDVFDNLGKKGVKMRLICDENAYKYINPLSKYGSIIKFKSDKFTKLHAKATLLDKKLLLIGSSNFDKSSLTTNMEILLSIDDKNISTRFYEIFNNIWNS